MAQTRPLKSGFCGAVPWPLPEGATYDPHRRCSLAGCVCPCHVPPRLERQ